MLSLGRTPSTVNYVYYRTCDLQILSFSLISLMLLCKAKSSLCWAKVFKYDKVQFHSFFFHYCSFHAKSKHSLLLLVLKIFFLFFFPERFWCFMFLVEVHAPLSIIFMKCIRFMVMLIWFPVMSIYSGNICWKTYSLSIESYHDL